MINNLRIRDLREDADETQQEIAKLLGTTQQQYCRYENEEREIPLHHLITLSKHFNISLDYLCGLINKPEKLFRS